MSLAEVLLLCLFKEPALSFIDIFHFLFSLCFICFCFDVYDYFLILTLDFACSFSSPFRWKVRLFM